MLSGVPNLAFALGYTNASWTLKCDLTCEYVCRLLNHMDEHGYRAVHAARARPLAADASRSSTSPPATCCARSTSSRSRASRPPWRLHQNYARDILMLQARRARGRGHGVLADRSPSTRRAARGLTWLHEGPPRLTRFS